MAVALDPKYERDLSDVDVAFPINGKLVRNSEPTYGAFHPGATKTRHYVPEPLPDAVLVSWNGGAARKVISVRQRSGAQFRGTLVFTIRPDDSVDLSMKANP